MFAICRSSTRITPNRRARSALTFSAQSLRRSPSRARSRAIACLTRPRRFEPRPARASVRCSRRSLIRSRPVRAGQCSNSPGGQGRGDHNAPVDAHRLAVTRRGHRRGDHGEGDMPPARAIPGHPVGLDPRRHRAGPAESHPSGFGHPDLAGPTGHAAHVPLSAARPRSEPLIPPALRHDGRPAGLPGSTNAAIARAKSRSACCCTVSSRRPATGAPPARRSAAGTAAGSPARGFGRGASGRAARPPGSTRTGRARSDPAAPPAGRASGTAGTGTYEHTIEYHRRFRRGEAACPPPPENRGLHAAILMSEVTRARSVPRASAAALAPTPFTLAQRDGPGYWPHPPLRPAA